MTQLRNVSVYWGTEDGLAPPDTPPCGFLGEFCPDEPTKQECNRLSLTIWFYSIVVHVDASCTYMFIAHYHMCSWCFPAYDVIIIIIVVCAVGSVLIAVFAVTSFLRWAYDVWTIYDDLFNQWGCCAKRVCFLFFLGKGSLMKTFSGCCGRLTSMI